MSGNNWTTDRPTEPGEYWVSLHPDNRDRLWASQSVMCVVVTWNQHGGFLSVRWFDADREECSHSINDLLFDCAKWSRRETPADPFEEVTGHPRRRPDHRRALRAVHDRESERMPIMSDRLAELLKLARNESGDTSDNKPPGVRVGDICSNGWASNRNPNKLFMYLGMTGDSFRGINIEGKSAGPVLKGNAVKIVLPRDTTWELLTKHLPLLCLALLCLSGCLTAAKIGQWQRAVYGWSMDASASRPCQVASAEASAYLAKANRTLAEAGKLTDLASDSRARELMNRAALACGRRMP